MPTTSNFGWTTPADTDLVKDGAAAIRTLGNGVDSSFVDLKGGTTGQFLSKNSNTDLDFTWANGGDITAVTAGTGISGGGSSGDVTITNSMATAIDAKGDLIVGTGADTFSRLAVGATNGHVLTVDSSTSTGLKYAAISSGGYTELASGSLSGNSLNLTSISGSYKELRIILRDYYYDTRGNLQLTFNGDTGSNYTTQGVQGQYTGTTYNPTAYSATGWPASYAWVCNGNNVNNAGGDNIMVLDIPDYANSTVYKVLWGSVYQRDNTSTYAWSFENHLWRNVAAITQITLKAEGTRNFQAGTYQLLGLA